MDQIDFIELLHMEDWINPLSDDAECEIYHTFREAADISSNDLVEIEEAVYDLIE